MENTSSESAANSDSHSRLKARSLSWVPSLWSTWAGGGDGRRAAVDERQAPAGAARLRSAASFPWTFLRAERADPERGSCAIKGLTIVQSKSDTSMKRWGEASTASSEGAAADIVSGVIWLCCGDQCTDRGLPMRQNAQAQKASCTACTRPTWSAAKRSYRGLLTPPIAYEGCARPLARTTCLDRHIL